MKIIFDIDPPIGPSGRTVEVRSDNWASVAVVPVGQVHQHRVPAAAFDQGADRGQVALADDQVALRKTVEGPGEPGVA